MMNQFPKNFLWCGATAANQYEGAYLEKNRSLSNVDFIPAKENHSPVASDALDPETLKDQRYPSRYAIDGYHHYKEEITILAQIGFNVYLFSICWSRIFPHGDENIVDECLKYHIEPLITINHFDVPLHLIHKYDSWRNRKIIDFNSRHFLL